MYENFVKLLEQKGVKVSDVSKATGIRQSVFSDWKAGRYAPKTDKLQLIADYFGVTIEELSTGQRPESYYFDPETAKIAQELYDSRDLRMLFDAARGVAPENLRLAAEMLRRFKGEDDD